MKNARAAARARWVVVARLPRAFADGEPRLVLVGGIGAPVIDDVVVVPDEVGGDFGLDGAPVLEVPKMPIAPLIRRARLPRRAIDEPLPPLGRDFFEKLGVEERERLRVVRIHLIAHHENHARVLFAEAFPHRAHHPQRLFAGPPLVVERLVAAPHRDGKTARRIRHRRRRGLERTLANDADDLPAHPIAVARERA